MMSTRRIHAIWVALLLATALTWWWGESASTSDSTSVWAEVLTAALVLGLAAFKGVFIALDYMELRHAPTLWRRLVLGWLAVVVVVLLALSVWHAVRGA